MTHRSQDREPAGFSKFSFRTSGIKSEECFAHPHSEAQNGYPDHVNHRNHQSHIDRWFYWYEKFFPLGVCLACVGTNRENQVDHQGCFGHCNYRERVSPRFELRLDVPSSSPTDRSPFLPIHASCRTFDPRWGSRTCGTSWNRARKPSPFTTFSEYSFPVSLIPLWFSLLPLPISRGRFFLPQEQEAVRGSLLLADPVPECRTLASMLEGEDISSQSLPPSQSPNIPQL